MPDKYNGRLLLAQTELANMLLTASRPHRVSLSFMDWLCRWMKDASVMVWHYPTIEQPRVLAWLDRQAFFLRSRGVAFADMTRFLARVATCPDPFTVIVPAKDLASELVRFSACDFMFKDLTFMGRVFVTVVVMRRSMPHCAFKQSDMRLLEIAEPIFCSAMTGALSDDTDADEKDPANWWRLGEEPPF